jgi:hypothetical protein
MRRPVLRLTQVSGACMAWLPEGWWLAGLQGVCVAGRGCWLAGWLAGRVCAGWLADSCWLAGWHVWRDSNPNPGALPY